MISSGTAFSVLAVVLLELFTDRLGLSDHGVHRHKGPGKAASLPAQWAGFQISLLRKRFQEKRCIKVYNSDKTSKALCELQSAFFSREFFYLLSTLCSLSGSWILTVGGS